MHEFSIFKEFDKWIKAGLISFVLLVLLPHVSAQALGITVANANGGTSFDASSGLVTVYVNATIDEPNITAIQFSLTYDPNLLRAWAVPSGSATSTWTQVHDTTQPGVIVVGMYSVTPLPLGTQQIALIKFTVKSPPIDLQSPLNIPLVSSFAGHNLYTAFNDINLNSSQITSGNFTLNASSYTLTGPSNGITNAASTNFTVTPNGAYTGNITITPLGGGLSSPIILPFANSSASQTFTIVPTQQGSVTLTATNNGGLTDPALTTYSTSIGRYGELMTPGSITVYDAQTVAENAVNLIQLTPSQAKVADVSGNPTPSIYDALLIGEYAVGLTNKCPKCNTVVN